MTPKNFSSDRSDSGSILLLVAFSMVALLGIAVLTLDASFMYDKRNRLHAAADGAAKSGAIEVWRNAAVTRVALEAFADQQVAANGFTSTRLSGTTTVTVNHPPLSGPYAGDINYVEVFTEEPTNTFLGSFFGLLNMTPGARAVAGTSSSPNCVITLAPPSATPEAITLGNAMLDMPGCAVVSGGDLQTDNPNSTIDSASTGLTGTCTGNASACLSNIANMSTGAPPPTDPLASVPTMTDPGGCTAVVVPNNTSVTLASGLCYSSIDATGNNVSITFSPGAHYIKGPFEVANNATITGSGVLLYFAGTAPSITPCTLAIPVAGCWKVANGASVTLSAQTSGTYSGILIYQEGTDHIEMAFRNGGPDLDLSGAVYVPGAHVEFENGAEIVSDCFLVVAYSLEIRNGNGVFNNNCSSYGGSPILTVSMAE